LDLATALRELWNRRQWVAIVAVVALAAAIITTHRVELVPPSLQKRSLEFGAAATQILIDSPRSSLADLNREFTPLAERAQVFAQFMTSPPVKDAIAREAGVPPSVVTAETSLATSNLPATAVEPDQGERANELLAEGIGYRLTFEARESLPVVSVRAQAPTAKEAIGLADAAVVGLRSYLQRAEAREQVPERQRVRAVQLGQAKGGLVNSGVNRLLAAMAFFAVFGVGCVMILLVINVLEGLRSDRTAPTWTSAKPEPDDWTLREVLPITEAPRFEDEVSRDAADGRRVGGTQRPS
jgi:hypothetical protein